MSTSNNRIFNCKDEELPVVSKFAAFGLKRDLADFTAFSPTFKLEYVTDFETKISVISDLVEPQAETLAKNLITDRLYATMAGLVKPLNYLSGYLALSKGSLKISDTDFGLIRLRKSINIKDVEGVLANLHVVIANVTTYKAALMEKGLTEEMITGLNLASQSLAADKQQQYEIMSNRKSIVQNNISLLNGVYEQLTEILSVGKIMYKASDAAKLADYTFADLLKKVRQSRKSAPEVAVATENNTIN